MIPRNNGVASPKKHAMERQERESNAPSTKRRRLSLSDQTDSTAIPNIELPPTLLPVAPEDPESAEFERIHIPLSPFHASTPVKSAQHVRSPLRRSPRIRALKLESMAPSIRRLEENGPSPLPPSSKELVSEERAAEPEKRLVSVHIAEGPSESNQNNQESLNEFQGSLNELQEDPNVTQAFFANDNVTDLPEVEIGQDTARLFDTSIQDISMHSFIREKDQNGQDQNNQDQNNQDQNSQGLQDHNLQGQDRIPPIVTPRLHGPGRFMNTLPYSPSPARLLAFATPRKPGNLTIDSSLLSPFNLVRSSPNRSRRRLMRTQYEALQTLEVDFIDSHLAAGVDSSVLNLELPQGQPSMRGYVLEAAFHLEAIKSMQEDAMRLTTSLETSLSQESQFPLLNLYESSSPAEKARLKQVAQSLRNRLRDKLDHLLTEREIAFAETKVQQQKTELGLLSNETNELKQLQESCTATEANITEIQLQNQQLEDLNKEISSLEEELRCEKLRLQELNAEIASHKENSVSEAKDLDIKIAILNEKLKEDRRVELEELERFAQTQENLTSLCSKFGVKSVTWLPSGMILHLSQLDIFVENGEPSKFWPRFQSPVLVYCFSFLDTESSLKETLLFWQKALKAQKAINTVRTFGWNTFESCSDGLALNQRRGGEKMKLILTGPNLDITRQGAFEGLESAPEMLN